MEQAPNFPNGWQSFIETYFIIAGKMEREMDFDNKCEVSQTKDGSGYMSLPDLAEKWALEFEEMNKNNAWDVEDFFDELDHFYDRKNKLDN